MPGPSPCFRAREVSWPDRSMSVIQGDPLPGKLVNAVERIIARPRRLPVRDDRLGGASVAIGHHLRPVRFRGGLRGRMRAAVFFRTHPVSMLKMRPQGISDKSAFPAGHLGQRLDPDVPNGYSANSMVSRQPLKFSGSKRPSNNQGASTFTADKFSGSLLANRVRISVERSAFEIMRQ